MKSCEEAKFIENADYSCKRGLYGIRIYQNRYIGKSLIKFIKNADYSCKRGLYRIRIYQNRYIGKSLIKFKVSTYVKS